MIPLFLSTHRARQRSSRRETVWVSSSSQNLHDDYGEKVGQTFSIRGRFGFHVPLGNIMTMMEKKRGSAERGDLAFKLWSRISSRGMRGYNDVDIRNGDGMGSRLLSEIS